MKNQLFFFLFLLAFISCSETEVRVKNDTKTSLPNKTLTSAEMDSSEVKLPYFQIPDAPDRYTSGNVIARMIDGLGYRFFWATEGLTDTDLNYKPSEKGRTAYETLEHILALSETIKNAPKNEPNIRPVTRSELPFDTMRAQTLFNLKSAGDLFRGKTEKEIAEMKIIFQRGEKSSEYPYWNMLNGPVADALWHTGQIVLMRRSSGNPLPKGVNVFLGKTRVQDK